MPVTVAVGDAIADVALPTVLDAVAVTKGMVPMRRDGLRKPRRA